MSASGCRPIATPKLLLEHQIEDSVFVISQHNLLDHLPVTFDYFFSVLMLN